ncbi:retrotransposon protein, putative, ty1-copia subclass [Tanacetum coccineum]
MTCFRILNPCLRNKLEFRDLSVGLILNGFTSDFAGFVRNYNMHNIGKTIGELHALLIKSVRSHRALERLCINVEVEEHSLGDLNEPTNYKATMLDPESNKWLDAMNAKMQFMKDNQVWCLVDLPPSAKGFTQTYMVDYEETFSPVADIRAIRILIAIAAFYDYKIWQMDVKTAFLNGYLDEDIYMV